MIKSNTSKNCPTKSRTDWERVDALRDEDIDVSEHPEMTSEMFAKAIARKGLNTYSNETAGHAKTGCECTGLVQGPGQGIPNQN